MKNLPSKLLLAGLALIALAVAVVLTAPSFADVPSLIGSLFLFGLGTGFSMRDATLKVTKALPNGAATTYSAGIDLGKGTYGDHLADCEILITAPALTTTELGDTQTIAYSIEHDTDSAFGTTATITGFASIITQTGAGGAGAAGTTARLRLPTSVKRYIRLKQVKTGASDASTSSGTLEVLF